MDEPTKKRLLADETGLATYEFICNNIGACDEHLPFLIENIVRADLDGQFTVSAARYLHAIDAVSYASSIDALISAAITKDRGRKYLSGLLSCVWGEDYMDRADELMKTDDNFRRVYKRVYEKGI